MPAENPVHFNKGDIWVFGCPMSKEEIEIEIVHTAIVPKERLKGSKIGIRYSSGQQLGEMDAFMLKKIGTIKHLAGSRE